MARSDELTDSYKALFLILFSFALFYPSIFGDILPIDDQQLLHHLLNIKIINWHKVFFRDRYGYYYRPILYISFLFDHFFMGSHSIWMHFMNILLHTISGLLVFGITKSYSRIFPINSSGEKDMFPFLSSVLFLCNPIVTESVNWISGRSDLLSGTFALFSLYLFIKRGQSRVFIFTSGLFFFLSILSKETGFALFPLILLLLYLNHTRHNQYPIWRPLTTTLTYLGFILIYVTMRFWGVVRATGCTTHVKKTMIPSCTNKAFEVVLPKLKIFLVAYGFYIKKLLCPVPLNFAIVNINMNLYAVFGILSIVGTLMIFYFLLRERRFILFFAVFSILFFLPAIPVAMYRIAWTPLAERYLYISSVGTAVILSYLLCSLNAKNKFMYLLKNGAIIVLFLSAGMVTYNRNVCWQSALKLYEDTVKKTPSFAPIRNDYAIVLKKNGHEEEALTQFQVAKRLYKGKNGSRIENNLLLTKSSSLDANLVASKLADLYDSTNDNKLKREILKNLLRVLGIAMSTSSSDTEKEKLIKTMIYYNSEGYKLFHDPFYLYRQGQLFLMLGEKEKAKSFFHKACLKSNDFFTSAACKLDKELGKELASNE